MLYCYFRIISMLVIFIIIVNTMLWLVCFFYVRLSFIIYEMFMLFLLNVHIITFYLYYYYKYLHRGVVFVFINCYLLTHLIY